MAKEKRAARAHRSWGQRLLLTFFSLVTLTCLAAAGIIGWARYRFEQIPRYGDIELASVASGEPENFLLVGSDSRENMNDDGADAGAFFNGEVPNGQRSDTVMVARVEPQQEKVTLLSIPRDLWLPIAGTGGEDRINTAYSDGRQTLIDTIQQSLGIPINHYIEVDFAGFRRLVEAIGGVPMWFDTAMKDDNTGLVVNGRGCVTLDGEQALALARSRHLFYVEDGYWSEDPTGDLGRIARQQALILEAVRRAVSLDLTNATRFNEMLDICVDSVGIDEGLSFDDMAGLALRFRSIGSDTIVNRTLPVEDYTTAGGASVLHIVEPDADGVLAEFRGGDGGSDVTPGLVQVKVINASGADGQAQAVGDALATIGFQFTGTEDFTGLPLSVTQVHYAPGEIAAADLVARHLTSPPDLVENASIAPGTVAVVTGLDFTTVQEQARTGEPPTAPDRIASPQDPVTNTLVTDPDGEVTEADGSQGAPITEAIGRPPSEGPPEIDCH